MPVSIVAGRPIPLRLAAPSWSMSGEPPLPTMEQAMAVTQSLKYRLNLTDRTDGHPSVYGGSKAHAMCWLKWARAASRASGGAVSVPADYKAR